MRHARCGSSVIASVAPFANARRQRRRDLIVCAFSLETKPSERGASPGGDDPELVDASRRIQWRRHRHHQDAGARRIDRREPARGAIVARQHDDGLAACSSLAAVASPPAAGATGACGRRPMTIAATPAAIARPVAARQKPTLFQSPAASRLHRGPAERRTDARPDMRGWLHRFASDSRAPGVLPTRRPAARSPHRLDAPLDLATRLGVEDAQYVFARQQFVAGRQHRCRVGFGAHRSRHSRNCSSPRRIQLLTEPSGDPGPCGEFVVGHAFEESRADQRLTTLLETLQAIIEATAMAARVRLRGRRR